MFKLNYSQGLSALSILLYQRVCFISVPPQSSPEVTVDIESSEQVYSR